MKIFNRIPPKPASNRIGFAWHVIHAIKRFGNQRQKDRRNRGAMVTVSEAVGHRFESCRAQCFKVHNEKRMKIALKTITQINGTNAPE